MRIIIVGGGQVGFGLAEALSPGHDVVVIDQNPAVAVRFEKLDVDFVTGGGTSGDSLRRAGVKDADVLVACTGLDEVNIVACAMASQLGSPDAICFVSREDFVRLPEGREGLTQFGIKQVIWPEAQLAAGIERIVATPGAIDAEDFAGGAIRLLEYRVEAQSPLTAGSVADLKLPRGSLFVAVRRGDTFFIPRGDSRLTTGDKVVVMGTPEAMAEVQHRFAPVREARRQTVTIIGGGDVGLQLAERLDARRGVDLRIIEHDPQRGELLAARLQRALVLNGDGTDLALLESEDIGRSDVLVSVIDHDEKNLLASLLGRQLGARRIITRVSQAANLRLFERVGIDVAISARGAAIASVLHQIEGGPTSLLAVLEQGEGRILEFPVPAPFVGRALRDLEPPRESIVGAILRGGRAIVPRGADQLEAGDRLVVFCTTAGIQQAQRFFVSS